MSKKPRKNLLIKNIDLFIKSKFVDYPLKQWPQQYFDIYPFVNKTIYLRIIDLRLAQVCRKAL